MTVICKAGWCPYNDKRGFCARDVAVIDENGMCNVVWKRGEKRRFTQFDEKHKKPITIFDQENLTIVNEGDDKNESGGKTHDDEKTSLVQKNS